MDPVATIALFLFGCAMSYQVGKIFERDRTQRAEAKELATVERRAAELRSTDEGETWTPPS